MQTIIAVVFDFDDTLAPDSTTGFLQTLGVDTKEFWGARVQPLVDQGWDPIPAYLYMMLQESKSSPKKNITRQRLAEYGRQITPYASAPQLFGRIHKAAKTIDPKIEVEFYLVSSGIGEILRNTKLARHFKDIWACDFHYDEHGCISYPKNIISFTDKTRYLFQISKGIIGPESRKRPFDVNKKIEARDLRIPFEQIIYVGDGFTDVPCFSLVQKQRGTAFGVYDQTNKVKWGHAWSFIQDGRVTNLVPAKYGKGSVLLDNIEMAIRSIAQKILLRAQAYQG